MEDNTENNWSTHELINVSPWDEDKDKLDDTEPTTENSDDENSDNGPELERQLEYLNEQLKLWMYIVTLLFLLVVCGISVYTNSLEVQAPLNHGFCRIGSYTFTPEQCRNIIGNYRLY